MKRYMDHMIHSAEERVTYFLTAQVKDKKQYDFGGIKGDIVDVKPTVYALTTAVAVYLNRKSSYYENQKLYEAICNGLDFIRKFQREDGSFDFPSCNFKSAPDTAFCFKRLIAAYRLLQKYETVKGTSSLKEKYLIILKDSLNILVCGGFHTPNHRWAITAALMQGVHLVGDEKQADQLIKRVNQYLLEGIDGNEDGEYAERSTGNYNAVVNSAMITMYEESYNPHYLEYVERNLKMMLYYIDPDDTIFTQNSMRQDKGTKTYLDKYFYQYLYMAVHNKDQVFDAAAHKIIKDNQKRGDDAPDCLHILMLNDFMREYTFKEYGYLSTYHKFFKESGVLRVRKEDFSYSILRDKASFVFMKFKDVPIYIRIGESYCDIRNFVPDLLQIDDKKYRLSSKVQGWYYLPFEQVQDTKDWWQMDHSKRNILNNSELEISVEIKELEKGLEFTIKTIGLDRLPLRVEVCIPAETILKNKHFYLKTSKGEEMILRSGYVIMQYNNQQILLGPGYGAHEFKGHYQGERKNKDGYTIYLNEYTPYTKKFFVKLIQDEL